MGLFDFVGRYLKLPFLESRALKYGYANARVKGMKGTLISSSTLEELIRIKSIDAMIELLQRTHYKDDLVSLSIRYKGSELVELAASAQFSKVILKLLKFVPKSDKVYLNALLKRIDILNLKTVLNARRAGKTFQDVRPYLIPAGSLDALELERIFSAQNILDELKRTELGQEMFSASTSIFTRQMLDSFKNALRNQDTVAQVQTFLDAYLYAFLEKAFSSVKPEIALFRKIFRNEIDAKNISIIQRLRSRSDKASVEKHLLSGGTLSKSALRRFMDAKDLSDVVELVRTHVPSIKISSVPSSPVQLEVQLEKAIALEKLNAFYRSTLSIGTILGFLMLKEEELNNLRKIAKGKEYGLSEEKIRETLVVL